MRIAQWLPFWWVTAAADFVAGVRTVLNVVAPKLGLLLVNACPVGTSVVAVHEHYLGIALYPATF